MLNKKVLWIFIFFTVLCTLQASDVTSLYLPSLHRASNSIYPFEKVLGVVAEPNATDAHNLLQNAFSQSYSFEWAEQYFSSDTKKPLAMLFSSELDNLLPSEDTMYSREVENADGSTSISVAFQKGIYYVFTVLEDKIIAISRIKN